MELHVFIYEYQYYLQAYNGREIIVTDDPQSLQINSKYYLLSLNQPVTS